jgi:hypothetical protein
MAVLNVNLNYVPGQSWDLVALSKNQGYSGLFLDSQQGLVVGGQLQIQFGGWLGKSPFAVLHQKCLIFIVCPWWDNDQPQLFWLSGPQINGIPPDCAEVWLLPEIANF